jgi:hypothetical protein
MTRNQMSLKRVTATTAAAALMVSGISVIAASAAPVMSSAAPLRTLTDVGMSGKSLGLTRDAAGRLYVVSDAAEADAEPALKGSVEVYAPGASGDDTPLRVIRGAQTGLDDPRRPAVDANGSLYVPNAGNGTITVYGPQASGDAKPIRTITSAGQSAPQSVDIGPDGNLYVSDGVSDSGSPHIRVFRPDAKGTAVPVRTIGGAKSGLASGGDVAFDRAGNVYLSAFSYESRPDARIVVFAAGASGDVAPKRVITSASMAWPGQIHLDSSDNLYVAEYVGSTLEQPTAGSILVFAANASTNAVPRAVLSGPSTGLVGPWNLLLDANRQVTVGNWDNGTVTTYAPLVPFTRPTAARAIRVAAPSKVGTRTITWTAPQDEGGHPVSYRVLVKRGSTTVLNKTLTGRSVTVNRSALRVGKHTVSVTASNRTGAATAASAAFTVVAAKATKVKSLRITGKASSKIRLVKWNPPAWDGGTKVKSYRLVFTYGKLVYATKTVKASGKRVVKLQSNRMAQGKYKVTVRAKTAKGYGAKASKSFSLSYF